jgi:hypothetical protein
MGRGVVEDPGTSRNSMHENRETSRASIETVDRSAKAPSHNAGMHAMEESDCCVVPVKQLNNGGQPSAEAAEGRRQPKENDAQSNTQPTQRGARVSQGLSGVRPSGAGKETRAVHGPAASRDRQSATGEF